LPLFQQPENPLLYKQAFGKQVEGEELFFLSKE
jgi:hypothetical protein